ERAANEAMRAAERKSMLARDGLGDPPTEAEEQEVKRLREIADALFRQATFALHLGTREVRTGQRLGYDEIWSLVHRST
ncbi:MAG TPA: hypothetical protein VFF05_00940, partial [Rudaea sp.]|nr:hypothetical protein [Rudaea sp.]